MNNYFCPVPFKGKYSWTWTVATRMGENLIAAEQVFGERDLNYTILGVEFTTSGPNTWYPFDGYIAIQLQMNCLAEEDRMLFQLAHEVVHLISPISWKEVTFLEEGAACWFQLKRMKEYGYEGWYHSEDKYKKALEWFTALISHDPEAIVKLRGKQPVMSKITYDDIMSEYPDFDEDVAKQLTKRMNTND